MHILDLTMHGNKFSYQFRVEMHSKSLYLLRTSNKFPVSGESPGLGDPIEKNFDTPEIALEYATSMASKKNNVLEKVTCDHTKLLSLEDIKNITQVDNVIQNTINSL